jgi:hypothetical protein
MPRRRERIVNRAAVAGQQAVPVLAQEVPARLAIASQGHLVAGGMLRGRRVQPRRLTADPPARFVHPGLGRGANVRPQPLVGRLAAGRRAEQRPHAGRAGHGDPAEVLQHGEGLAVGEALALGQPGQGGVGVRPQLAGGHGRGRPGRQGVPAFDRPTAVLAHATGDVEPPHDRLGLGQVGLVQGDGLDGGEVVAAAPGTGGGQGDGVGLGDGLGRRVGAEGWLAVVGSGLAARGLGFGRGSAGHAEGGGLAFGGPLGLFEGGGESGDLGLEALDLVIPARDQVFEFEARLPTRGGVQPLVRRAVLPRGRT